MRLNDLMKKETTEINNYITPGNYTVTLAKWDEVKDSQGNYKLELTYNFPDGVQKADRFGLDESQGPCIAQRIISFLMRLTGITEKMTLDKALDKIIKEKKEFYVAVYDDGSYQNMKLITSLDEKIESRNTLKDKLKTLSKEIEGENLPF